MWKSIVFFSFPSSPPPHASVICQSNLKTLTTFRNQDLISLTRQDVTIATAAYCYLTEGNHSGCYWA